MPIILILIAQHPPDRHLVVLIPPSFLETEEIALGKIDFTGVGLSIWATNQGNFESFVDGRFPSLLAL